MDALRDSLKGGGASRDKAERFMAAHKGKTKAEGEEEDAGPQARGLGLPPAELSCPAGALPPARRSAMAKTVGDFVLARLQQWGVRRAVRLSGRRHQRPPVGARAHGRTRIDFVQVRHEEKAAFMACGHAQFTGEVGVCLATSGPGAIHLLNGLYDAKLDRQPVLAIVGQQPRAVLGGHYQQEVDLANLMKDVASFVQVCAGARAGAPPDRPGDAHRPSRTLRERDHLPQRRAGGSGGRAQARAWHGA